MAPTSLKWKTLGLATKSRIWVTAQPVPAPFDRQSINPLNLTGQSGLSGRRKAAMARGYGRNAQPLRRLFLLWVIGVVLYCSSLNAFTALDYFYSTLSLELIRALFWPFFGCMLTFLWAWVHELNIRGITPLSHLFGIISCGFLACTVFSKRVEHLLILTAQTPMKKKDIFAPTVLFMDLKNKSKATQADKERVRTAYVAVSWLQLFNRQGASLPDPRETRASSARTQRPLLSKLTPLPGLYEAPVLGLMQAWPTVAQVLAGQPRLFGLQLFSLQSIHQSAPSLLRSGAPLWHLHRLAGLRLPSAGFVTRLDSGSMPPQFGDTCVPGWFPSVAPLTTYLAPRAPSATFCYTQALRSAETPSWSAPRPALTPKVNLSTRG